MGDAWVQHSAEAAAAILPISTPVADRAETDMAYDLNRKTTDSGVYPLVLVSYLVGCNDYDDDATGVLVQAYASYIISEAGQAAAADAAGSAPVTGAIREQAAAIASAIK